MKKPFKKARSIVVDSYKFNNVPTAIGNVLLADSKSARYCEKCERQMKPANAKFRADGEQTYCGYLPCPCDKRIMTDFGVVYPNTEEHNMIIDKGQWNYNDLM